MIERVLMQIVETDLLKLISDPVREGRTIEYKAELNLKTDDAKRKFLASIASFANAAGGDFALGMKTDRADKALPIALQPLAGFNPDADVLMLQDIIRRHIEHKIFAIEFKSVAVAGGAVLVIRIRKTWSGVHMVTYNDDYRFYSRNQGGRYLMEVPEIRAAFLAGETAVRRLTDFRSERLAKLVSGERMVSISDGPLLVLHIFALESFAPGFRAELRNLTDRQDDWMLLAPRLKQHGWRLRFSLDGPMAYFSPPIDPQKAALYTQVFRNGAVEFVDADYFARSDEIVSASGAEMEIIGATSKLIEAMKRLSINPPYYVLPSLLGVNGWKLEFFINNRQKDTRPISHENIILPETLIEDADIDLPRAFQTVFDVMFNSCGLRGSPHFDSAGSYLIDWQKHYA